MIVSINQPCYLPWCGLFERIARADVHVHLDDVQYSKNTFFARNRAIDRAGREIVLSVPVQATLTSTIATTPVVDKGWRRKHFLSLVQAYGKYAPATALLEEMRPLFERPYANLAELNIAFLEWMLKVLALSTPTIRSSALGIEGKGTTRLVDICRQLGGTEYYSPAGAREYIDPEEFASAGIRLSYQSYVPFPYDQAPVPRFVPFLSAIDPLLRHGGEKARAIILGRIG